VKGGVGVRSVEGAWQTGRYRESGPSVPSRIRAEDKGGRLDEGNVHLDRVRSKKDTEEKLERSRPAVALEKETVLAGEKYTAVTWRWCSPL